MVSKMEIEKTRAERQNSIADLQIIIKNFVFNFQERQCSFPTSKAWLHYQEWSYTISESSFMVLMLPTQIYYLCN